MFIASDFSRRNHLRTVYASAGVRFFVDSTPFLKFYIDCDWLKVC